MSRYTRVERLLHRLAFATMESQVALADMEDRMFALQLNRVSIQAPIFITSLPRAGTTVLLEAIAASDGVASATYRDMPFVLAPMLWDIWSRNLRKVSVPAERMHGDGMEVGYDSPEAFSEAIWKSFWPDKYANGRIAQWSKKDRSDEFESFLINNMKKILLLRLATAAVGGRFVSKNNADIARLPLLQAIFPDCRLVVPFRHPLQQASSLLTQHLRFLEIHSADAFTRRYMDAIGHYEFGALLKPIDFGPGEPPSSSLSLAYWLWYWHRAFAFVLRTAPQGTIFVNYDRLCDEPAVSLASLERSLALDIGGQAFRFKAPKRHEPKLGDADDAELSTALQIYGELQNRGAADAR